MSANIITGRFPERHPAPIQHGDIGEILASTPDNIQTLLSASRIPWVRQVYRSLTGTNECFREFFDALFYEKKVTIISDEPEITLASVMKVESAEGEEWEIGVDIFVGFLELPPGALHDDELSGYIMQLLNVADIAIGLRTNMKGEDDGGCILVDIDDAGDFFPENTFSCTKEKRKMLDFYEVAVDLDNPDNGVYTSADCFSDAESLPVLYMMLATLQDALMIGYTLDDTREIGVYHNTRDKERGVTMTFARMVEEIDRAIIRKWPLYTNYIDKSALRTMIYDRYVAPRILSVFDEDIDEE